MYVVAKSAPIKEEILDRVRKGFKFIEVQLMGDNPGEKELDTILEAIRHDNIEVVNIHTPLLPRSENNSDIEVCIEYLTNTYFYNILDKTCMIAQQIAIEESRDIGVVIHNSFCRDNYENIPILLNELTSIFNKLISKYSNVTYLIENVTPVTFDDNKRNGIYIDDCYYIANYLNEHCNTDKFALTFDTCHWIMTKIDYMNTIKKDEKTLIDGYKFRDFSIHKVIEDYGRYIKNIHLNSLDGCGTSPSTHGIRLKSCDKYWITELLESYINNKCDALLTLEVRETDYFDCKALVKSYDLLENIAKHLDLKILKN